MEDLTSRLPGMFAYVEFDEGGNPVLHPGVDAVDGCYGKIVENIALPCGVNLCTYVQTTTDAIPQNYHWVETNTLKLSDDPLAFYNETSPDYLRHPYRFSYAEMEYDESIEYTPLDTLPEELDDESPEYVMTPLRDRLGEVVHDCDTNIEYVYYQKVPSYEYYAKMCIFSEGETYSYRTLIHYYYLLKDELGPDDTFISFMNEGIGKVYIDKRALGVDNASEYPYVPDYIYLAESSDLYNKYMSYHRLQEYYNSHFLNLGLTNDRIEEKLKYYHQIGGERVRAWLLEMTDKAQEVSELYLCYAEHAEYGVSAYVNIPLFQSYNDLGVRESYINDFIPGERYMHGEMFTYDMTTYICDLTRWIPGSDRNFEYIRCNDKYYHLDSSGYTEITFTKAYTTTLPTGLYDNAMYIIFNNEYYIWNNSGYEKIEMTESASSWIDDVTWEVVFDDQHFRPITEVGSDPWYDQDNPFGESYKIFYDCSVVPTYFISNYIRVGGIVYYWDGGQYQTDPDQGLVYNINGTGESQLTSFRNIEQFTDVFGHVQRPQDYEDWLCLYKVGNVGYHVESRDSSGNIERDHPDAIPNQGDMVTDLHAYGNVLLDITYDQIDKTLTFKYVINGHLKAIFGGMMSTSDGREIYGYGQFQYDENSTAGIVYEDTYYYTDPMIDRLINNGDFQNFIHGNISAIPNYYQNYGFEHFAFNTNQHNRTVNIGNAVIRSTSRVAEFSEDIINQIDMLRTPTFHKDWLNGIMFDPRVSSDVDISRGNAAMFEKNIRLSEIHSIEDMQQEQNGSAYKISE